MKLRGPAIPLAGPRGGLLFDENKPARNARE